MKKVILLTMIILIMSVLCYGCNKSKMNEGSKFECPSEINKNLTDYITVNAKVTIPESAKDGTVQALEVKPHDFPSQKEKIQQLLGNNKYFYIEPGYIEWSSDYAMNVLNTIKSDPQYDDYNADLYLKDKNLAFMSQADAFNKVKSTLNKLNIEVSDRYVCYVMDYRIMEEQEDVKNAFGEEKKEEKKAQWTEDDNLYYFRIQRIYNDILIVGDEVFANSPNQNMLVMYNKGGIQKITIMDYYDITEKENEINLITVEDAIEKIKQKYDAVISEDKISITNIELCMKTINQDTNGGKAIIVPAWKFQITTKVEDPEIEPYSENVLINAETGKEIL
ncbi:hypothetical protein [Anaerosacchariphilus polymeriproducens]|uniref:Uncharacterized protein n=1 Tax=Anaerosacchariphilus polymeriproducens TaxID=1812858 RepID=A0A371AYA4_9FIRM|nr:hypothetical protein [Anaerosacchariphilus polymeriproducens]RDU24509.1 hypothetical protein DWV06_03330 [Anaerosacchariphilus polymeriproducens]